MKIILFFIFLILPTFANSFDDHYKFDHWAYERIMFGKTESREEAKKLLDSYKLNNLEVRDTNKPYLGPIIDGHSHPRKSTGKALDIGTEYFIEDLPMLTNKANVFMSVIMGTPNTYKSEDNWNYYYDFAAEHQNVLTNCHSNFIGMSANKKKYKKSEDNIEIKETTNRIKKGHSY